LVVGPVNVFAGASRPPFILFTPGMEAWGMRGCGEAARVLGAWPRYRNLGKVGKVRKVQKVRGLRAWGLEAWGHGGMGAWRHGGLRGSKRYSNPRGRAQEGCMHRGTLIDGVLATTLQLWHPPYSNNTRPRVRSGRGTMRQRPNRASNWAGRKVQGKRKGMDGWASARSV
jgi:hypothetical protein